MASQVATDAARQKLAGGNRIGSGGGMGHGTRLEQNGNAGKPCWVLASAVAGAYLKGVTALLFACLWQNSSGLKHFRGGWLCPDPGPVIWRPPVKPGPRELTPPRLLRSPSQQDAAPQGAACALAPQRRLNGAGGSRAPAPRSHRAEIPGLGDRRGHHHHHRRPAS